MEKSTRMKQLKKLLDILETSRQNTLSGGGVDSRDEDIMMSHLNILKQNFSNEQINALTTSDESPAYLQPTQSQKMAVTGNLLTELLTPEQIQTFRTQKLVDLHTMTPAQIDAFADLSMGHVMGQVLNHEQFRKWSTNNEVDLSYAQAKALFPVLSAGAYRDGLGNSNRHMSNNLHMLGNLTKAPLTNFIAEAPAQLRAGGKSVTDSSKISNIRDLISKIEKTISNMKK